MPLTWACRRQGATSAHTQEAETVSLAHCMREDALPLQDLVQLLLRKPVALVVKEDNTACIQAVRKGYSPALRSMPRTQRVSLGDLHETFQEQQAQRLSDGPVQLQHQETKLHKGDVFTKYLDPTPYHDALRRLGVSRSPKRDAKSPKRAASVGGAPALEAPSGPKRPGTQPRGRSAKRS